MCMCLCTLYEAISDLVYALYFIVVRIWHINNDDDDKHCLLWTLER